MKLLDVLEQPTLVMEQRRLQILVPHPGFWSIYFIFEVTSLLK